LSRVTTLLLLLVVGALGFFVYQQAEREAEHPPETLEALFKGVEPTRVSAIRFENLERSIHARFERDDRGAWFLTDPIAYPAAPEIVEQVLQIVAGNLAGPVPPALADRTAAGLAPVRGFLEVEETMPEGPVRRTRVELGGVDLDGQRVFVARDGRVLRTPRNLETVLERDLPDLRSRRLFRVDPSTVVELERLGRIYLENSAPSADWSAVAEGESWRMYRPLRARLDGHGMQLYTTLLGSLRARRFVTDLPDADLAPYGLAPAWFSVRLRDSRGAESIVEFGQNESRTTYARHPGLPHVYELDDQSWNMLVEGVDNLGLLMEHWFHRLRRDSLKEVTLERGGRVTRLSRSTEGKWSVSERPVGETEFRLAVPAEHAAVDDLLTRLENDAKLTYLLDRRPEDAFPEGAPRDSIWLTPYGDRRQGGFVGGLVEAADGTQLLAFAREDEGVLAGLDPALSEVLDLDAAHFFRRVVWDVTEVLLRELTITHADRTKRYVRGDGFTWRPSDADVPARELRQLLDSILFLKADGEVPAAERSELTDIVRLELVDADGLRLVAELGVNPAGVVELIHGVRRAKALDQGLHAALKALCGS
jgi:hypothetical protein